MAGATLSRRFSHPNNGARIDKACKRWNKPPLSTDHPLGMVAQELAQYNSRQGVLALISRIVDQQDWDALTRLLRLEVDPSSVLERTPRTIETRKRLYALSLLRVVALDTQTDRATLARALEIISTIAQQDGVHQRESRRGFASSLRARVDIRIKAACYLHEIWSRGNPDARAVAQGKLEELGTLYQDAFKQVEQLRPFGQGYGYTKRRTRDQE